MLRSLPAAYAYLELRRTLRHTSTPDIYRKIVPVVYTTRLARSRSPTTIILCCMSTCRYTNIVLAFTHYSSHSFSPRGMLRRVILWCSRCIPLCIACSWTILYHWIHLAVKLWQERTHVRMAIFLPRKVVNTTFVILQVLMVAILPVIIPVFTVCPLSGTRAVDCWSGRVIVSHLRLLSFHMQRASWQMQCVRSCGQSTRYCGHLTSAISTAL